MQVILHYGASVSDIARGVKRSIEKVIFCQICIGEKAVPDRIIGENFDIFDFISVAFVRLNKAPV